MHVYRTPSDKTHNCGYGDIDISDLEISCYGNGITMIIQDCVVCALSFTAVILLC